MYMNTVMQGTACLRHSCPSLPADIQRGLPAQENSGNARTGQHRSIYKRQISALWAYSFMAPDTPILDSATHDYQEWQGPFRSWLISLSRALRYNSPLCAPLASEDLLLFSETNKCRCRSGPLGPCVQNGGCRNPHPSQIQINTRKPYVI